MHAMRGTQLQLECPFTTHNFIRTFNMLRVFSSPFMCTLKGAFGWLLVRRVFDRIKNLALTHAAVLSLLHPSQYRDVEDEA